MIYHSVERSAAFRGRTTSSRSSAASTRAILARLAGPGSSSSNDTAFCASPARSPTARCVSFRSRRKPRRIAPSCCGVRIGYSDISLKRIIFKYHLYKLFLSYPVSLLSSCARFHLAVFPVPRAFAAPLSVYDVFRLLSFASCRFFRPKPADLDSVGKNLQSGNTRKGTIARHQRQPVPEGDAGDPQIVLAHLEGESRLQLAEKIASSRPGTMG